MVGATRRRGAGNARGRRTRQLILAAAERVFLERGSARASVAEICRRASLANGAFYRHFRSKGEVFLELARELGLRLAASLERDLEAGPTPEAGLERAAGTVLDVLARELALFQILREAEFVAPRVGRAFYGRLERTFERACASAGHGRAPSLLPYLVLGAAYFNGIRSFLWEGRPLPARARRTVASFVRRGIDPQGDFREPPGTATEVAAAVERALSGTGPTAGPQGPPPTRGEATRRRLLDAALERFASRGLAGTEIADVARRARVAVGTVYIHFESKEALVATLVREIGLRLRAAVRGACAGASDRREIEARALRAFLEFLRSNLGIYRVVREAEFQVPAAGRSYYQDLAKAYAEGLEAAMDRGEVRRLDPTALAYALMGFGHFVGRSAVVSAGGARPAEALVRQAIALVMRGAEGA